MSIRINFADSLSAQLAKVAGESSSFVLPSDYEGRQRVAYFDHDNGKGDDNVDSGEVVALCKLPKGARILGGVLRNTAHGSSAVGTVSVVDMAGSAIETLSGALDVNDTDNKEFANTIALKAGMIMPSAGYLIITAGANWTTDDATIAGHVTYVVD